MTQQTIDSPEVAETVESVDTTIGSPTLEPKPSRMAAAIASVKAAPKWVLMAVLSAVVALGGYSYLHGDQTGAMVGKAALVGPAGKPQGFVPVAFGPDYAPAYGNYYGHNGYGDAYGNGYGRGYGHTHGNGHARGNFGFSMGGNLDGDAGGWGNGYGDGYGYNRYNHNGYYY
jgi:hypothetical protein